MPVEQWRSEEIQEFDGQSDEVVLPWVSNGDVHLLFYAKYSLKKQRETGFELEGKVMFRERKWGMSGLKIVFRLTRLPFSLMFQVS